MSDFLERKLGELTVRIDREACISTANCMVVAPDLFVRDHDDLCAFREAPHEVDRERLIEACQVCPVDALILIDADGTQIVPRF